MTEPTPPTPASYKDTLNLPKTNFDMKANLLTREPAMLKQWQEADLYGQIRKRPHPKGKWILHDGPPYANGDIHMGHLINKVLKDIVVKFRTMQGYDSPYVPGWDCHGLPIESAIQKELGPKFRELSKEEVRNKCHDYAMKFVKLQGEGFKRLGVLGDWERPYLTLDPKYEAGILEVLAELVNNKLVYRKKKPVHWCINDRTALAEAELEYANRRDNSIYVSFPIALNIGTTDWHEFYFRGRGVIPTDKKLPEEVPSDWPRLLIWTTTPWTLPANQAVAAHPDHEYVCISFEEPGVGRRNYIIASALAPKIAAIKGITEYAISSPKKGKELCKEILLYSSPLLLPKPGFASLTLASYVTLEDGTGLVHIAPGHGTEDYKIAIQDSLTLFNMALPELKIYNPVLPDGRYDDTVPEYLRGKNIWDGNEIVIEKLRELEALFHIQVIDHSYPHCWRCKKPVIFRATEQWFVQVDKGYFPTTGVYMSIRDRSLRWTRNDTQFIPNWGKNRLEGMLQTRPDWCISRQRSWGVPIPAFFDDKGNCLLTEKSTRAVAAYFKQHGATSWYTDSPEKILGATEWEDQWTTPSGTIENRKSKIENWSKGADILDVWFESGASHHAVLECTHPELGYPAELYLEGSDQHRGWFQSSLLEAAGYKKEPPFKALLTHGFIVDEKGRKMSKSEGNDIKVETALKEFGADILRLWVCSVDYQNDIPCSKELFKTIGEAYRKIRNTIRYLLGNLYDFNPTTDMVDPAPHSIDQWMSNELERMAATSYHGYHHYEFHKIFRNVYEFCNVQVSATYAKAIKDRLYCELPNSPKRRASQAVCYRMLVRLIELVAPVLVYTADEAWAELRKLPGGEALEPCIHLRVMGVPKPLAKAFAKLDDLRVMDVTFANWANDPSSAEHFKEYQEQLQTFAATVTDIASPWGTPSEIAAHNHWLVLLPLVEKGLKQLDDLKKTVGLGNALDAEAVIILPSVHDEVSNLIADYGPEIEDALGVGFHRIEHGETWDIKIHDTREKYPSCARSWKRRPDVGSDPLYPDLSARDAAVVRKLRV